MRSTTESATRWNSGGQIPDRFIELLNRPMLVLWAVRNGESWQWPPVAHVGPMAILINGWSGSGGDAFPFYFKESGLGPLIGERTWGGLIGVSGAPGLIDSGGVTIAMNAWEFAFITHRRGAMDDNIWTGWDGYDRSLMPTKPFLWFWRENGPTFSPEFSAYVHSTLGS